ncbi:MAG: hypothetical protein IJ257_06950 [Treponema sp.]|nr:hypothetical protein [Treponema sp.]
MKSIKKITLFTSALALLTFAVSCASSANMDSTVSKQDVAETSGTVSGSKSDNVGAVVSSQKVRQLPPPPAKITEAPKFDFTGEKLQIEAENMYYDGFDLVGDFNASQSYGLKLLNDSSWAIAEINFPAGSYEGLVNVLAPNSEHSRFTVYINKDTFLVYGSEPPIGKYELTTRSPVSFTLDQPTTITLKIQQNDIRNPANKGQNGMTIDYVSFKKIK